jgi:hypothetical protein
MPASAQPDGFLGDWFATLDVGAAKLRLRLNIGDGPRATLFSIDQGNAPIPASLIRVEGTKLQIEWKVLGASLDGTLASGAIAGTFTQGRAFPLTFTRIAAAPAEAVVLPLTQERLAAHRAKAGSPAMIAAARTLAGRSVSFADGQRRLGNPLAVKTSDKWHMGSCTKSMTATLIARLAEDGIVSWNDTVGSVLGTTIEGLRAEYRDANFLHLLSHRSGLAGNIPLAALTRFPRESADAREDRKRYATIALQAAAGPQSLQVPVLDLAIPRRVKPRLADVTYAELSTGMLTLGAARLPCAPVPGFLLQMARAGGLLNQLKLRLAAQRG